MTETQAAELIVLLRHMSWSADWYYGISGGMLMAIAAILVIGGRRS